MKHMVKVGVRELRQRASELSRRVVAGERFEVTDRGRPVALLVPMPAGAPLDRLRASGDLHDSSAIVELAVRESESARRLGLRVAAP